MDYAKLSKCWRETVYGNNITLCGGKDPLHRVFYLHKSNMCAMIRKRTYVLKGAEIWRRLFRKKCQSMKNFRF